MAVLEKNELALRKTEGNGRERPPTVAAVMMNCRLLLSSVPHPTEYHSCGRTGNRGDD